MDRLIQFIPLVVLAIATVFALYWARWQTSTFDYQCANCGQIFGLSPWQALAVPHAMGKKWLKCPTCGQATWAAPVPKV